jgi:hypothetical protein
MLTIPASLRTTARALRRTPGFFLIAVFTLAVGIGANAAIFTVLNAVLLRPLPYPEPQGIMGVAHKAPGVNAPDRFELSDGTYFVFRRDNRTLEDIGIYWDDSVTLTGGREPERVRASGATASVFSVLRATPARGRTVQPEDEKPGADPVVVLSDPRHRGSDDRHDGSDSRQRGSDDRQDGPDSRQRGSDDRQDGSDTRQRGSDDRQDGSDTRQRGSDDRQDGSDTRQRGSDDRQDGFDTRQRGPDDRQDGSDTRHRGPDDRQNDPDSRRRAPDSRCRCGVLGLGR